MKGKNTSKVICHIPHSSVVILNPKGILKDITQAEIQAELNLVTDLHTEKIWAKGETIVFPANRLYCDVERLDDSLEAMAQFGRGIAYTKLDSGKVYRDTSSIKEEILRSYNEHATKVSVAVDKKLEEFGTCLIIDCHSFNDLPLETDLNKETPRPDICIGTDSFHTPSLLREITDDVFRSFYYSIKENSPYAGCYIPLKHFQKDARVMGIMVEINKKLYLDKTFEIIPDGYNKLKKVVDLFLAVMNISDFSNQNIQTKNN